MRDKVKDKTVYVDRISTNMMKADVLTKANARENFKKPRQRLQVVETQIDDLRLGGSVVRDDINQSMIWDTYHESAISDMYHEELLLHCDFVE